MDTKQIIRQKQVGDVRTVANIIGETYHNTDRIFRRPKSKKHARAVAVLTKIIQDRELSLAAAKKMIESN